MITSVVSRPRSYTLVDLEPCLRLQHAYLSRLGVEGVEFASGDRLPDEGAYDLVVSNYAFSECVREIQEHYLGRVLGRSTRGYLTCNWITPGHFRSFAPDELLAAIPGSWFVSEVPKTAPANRIWVWGSDEGITSSTDRIDGRRPTP